MSDGYFNKRLTGGQSARRRWLAVVDASRVLLFVSLLVTTGCASIYHRTQSGLPPDPVNEVELRLAEARSADDHAGQAGRKLLGHLRRGMAETLIAADFDRLEAAGFELERRALAARDSAGRAGESAAVTAEINRLLQRTQAWLTYVQAGRLADRATQIDQLAALLTNPAR